MSPRNWAFLLCRILSLYFLILGLQHLLLGTYTVFNLALKNGDKMIGVVLRKNEKRIDIGTPETYSKILVSLKK